jgi:hypothetical protein
MPFASCCVIELILAGFGVQDQRQMTDGERAKWPIGSVLLEVRFGSIRQFRSFRDSALMVDRLSVYVSSGLAEEIRCPAPRTPYAP